MEKTIAVLGGDRRMALLARLLAEDGHPVRTWGLAAFGMEDTALEEAAQADRVVLPVPLSRGKNLNCTAAALPLCGLFALLRPEQRLYAGGVKTADREAAAEFGLTLTDYLSREELAFYYSKGLVYTLGEEEQRGLSLFYQMLADAGMIAKAPALEFFKL